MRSSTGCLWSPDAIRAGSRGEKCDRAYVRMSVVRSTLIHVRTRAGVETKEQTCPTPLAHPAASRSTAHQKAVSSSKCVLMLKRSGSPQISSSSSSRETGRRSPAICETSSSMENSIEIQLLQILQLLHQTARSTSSPTTTSTS